MEGDTSHADQHSESEGARTSHRGMPPWPPDQRKWDTHHRGGKDMVPVLPTLEANDEILRVVATNLRIIRHQVKPLEEVAGDTAGLVPPTTATRARPSASSAACNSTDRRMTMNSVRRR